MTPEHAHNLAVRYHHIWRGGPPVTELETQLANHDFDPATAAMSRLAREQDYPPTIHQLIAEIRGCTITGSIIPQPENTGPPTALDDVIARLEHKQHNGTASDNDLADLNRWRRLRNNAPSST
jgi:hypothetical protein